MEEYVTVTVAICVQSLEGGLGTLFDLIFTQHAYSITSCLVKQTKAVLVKVFYLQVMRARARDEKEQVTKFG